MGLGVGRVLARHSGRQGRQCAELAVGHTVLMPVALGKGPEPFMKPHLHSDGPDICLQLPRAPECQAPTCGHCAPAPGEGPGGQEASQTPPTACEHWVLPQALSHLPFPLLRPNTRPHPNLPSHPTPEPPKTLPKSDHFSPSSLSSQIPTTATSCPSYPISLLSSLPAPRPQSPRASPS